MPIWLNRNPEPPTVSPQKSVRQTIKTSDAACVVLAQCDVREPKIAARKAPLKAVRISRSVTRVAASRKGNGVRKDNKANKASKAKDAKGSMLTLASMDSKIANTKVVTNPRSLAQGRPIVARSWVIRMPRSALLPQRPLIRLQRPTMLRSAPVKANRYDAI